MNGIQMFSVKDTEILRRRGQNIQRPDPSEVANRMVIKKGDSVPFEIVFVDPPDYKDYALNLKNLDQESMKEIMADTLKGLKDIRR